MTRFGILDAEDNICHSPTLQLLDRVSQSVSVDTPCPPLPPSSPSHTPVSKRERMRFVESLRVSVSPKTPPLRLVQEQQLQKDVWVRLSLLLLLTVKKSTQEKADAMIRDLEAIKMSPQSPSERLVHQTLENAKIAYEQFVQSRCAHSSLLTRTESKNR